MNQAAILTAVAVLLGAVASAASTQVGWVRALYAAAALLSIVAILLQVRAGRPHVRRFDVSDWQLNEEGELEIVVPAKRHGKGRSATGRLERAMPNGDWETVVGGAVTRSNGDVVATVSARSTLEGRIVVY